MLYKHVVHENVVGGSTMIWFPLLIAVSKGDMQGIEPGPLGWHTSDLANELQEVRHVILSCIIEQLLGFP